MAIDRNLFDEKFTIATLSKIECPVCEHGYLELLDGSYRQYESAESKARSYDESIGVLWESGTFTCTLTCNNKRCQENIQLIGDLSDCLEWIVQTESGQPSQEVVTYLSPTSFSHPINIFKIHHHVPAQIKDAIQRSFRLFWVDESSCGNRIRTIAELIMDDFAISSTTEKNGKVKYLTLDARIEIFSEQYPSESELLHSIRWIGNASTHRETITKNDIIEAYEILELILDRLYNRDADRIKTLSGKINATKKPSSATSVNLIRNRNKPQ